MDSTFATDSHRKGAHLEGKANVRIGPPGQLGEPNADLFDHQDRQRVCRAGGGKNILRVASRRQAAQLVISANELLNSLPSLPEDTVPSIAPDAGSKADPERLADPSEAS
jgi:hypothetical protein